MIYPLALTFKNNLDNFPKENMSQRYKENLLVTVFVPDFDESKHAETYKLFVCPEEAQVKRTLL